MMGEGNFARTGNSPAPQEPYVGDGVVGGAGWTLEEGDAAMDRLARGGMNAQNI